MSALAVYNECDELRGRLYALGVKFPEMQVPVNGALEELEALLGSPLPGTIAKAIEEMILLRNFLAGIVDIPEVAHDVRPTLELVDRLLGPDDRSH